MKERFTDDILSRILKEEDGGNEHDWLLEDEGADDELDWWPDDRAADDAVDCLPGDEDPDDELERLLNDESTDGERTVREYLQERAADENSGAERRPSGACGQEKQISHNEICDLYEDLVKRLRSEGIYRENPETMAAIAEWHRQKYAVAVRHYRRAKVAAIIILALLGVFAAGMVSSSDSGGFTEMIRYVSGADLDPAADSASDDV